MSREACSAALQHFAPATAATTAITHMRHSRPAATVAAGQCRCYSRCYTVREHSVAQPAPPGARGVAQPAPPGAHFAELPLFEGRGECCFQQYLVLT